MDIYLPPSSKRWLEEPRYKHKKKKKTPKKSNHKHEYNKYIARNIGVYTHLEEILYCEKCGHWKSHKFLWHLNKDKVKADFIIREESIIKDLRSDKI